MMKKIVFAGLLLLLGTSAFAQDYSKVEISGNYSYFRFHPQNANILGNYSFNGGGGAATFFLTSMIGIKGELEGYSSIRHSFNITNPGICDSETGTCAGSAKGNLFTYNVGPEFKLRMGKFEPFAEALFGGAHSNVNGNLATGCTGCFIQKSPNNNAFDFIIGGGFDIAVSKSIAIRPVELDYVLTRFGNGFTNGNNNQSNLRYQGGVVFRF